MRLLALLSLLLSISCDKSEVAEKIKNVKDAKDLCRDVYSSTHYSLRIGTDLITKKGWGYCKKRLTWVNSCNNGFTHAIAATASSPMEARLVCEKLHTDLLRIGTNKKRFISCKAGANYAVIVIKELLHKQKKQNNFYQQDRNSMLACLRGYASTKTISLKESLGECRKKFTDYELMACELGAYTYMYVESADKSSFLDHLILLSKKKADNSRSLKYINIVKDRVVKYLVEL